MYFLSLEAPGNFVPKKRLRVNVTTVTTIIHFLLDASGYTMLFCLALCSKSVNI